MKPLKIAYISGSNPLDKRAWSGIHYHLFQALNKYCGEVEVLRRPELPVSLFIGKVKSYLAQKLLRKRFAYKHSTALSKQYARYFTQKLKEKHYDLIFAPAASTEIAFLETNIPIVSLSDTTFSNMVNYYLTFTNLTRRSLKQGTEIERRALSNSAAILYPSSWAAESAARDYGIAASKLKVIPLGANMEEVPALDVVLTKPFPSACRLLFFGVDWQRKGGEIAFEAMLELNNRALMLLCWFVAAFRPKTSGTKN
jgi:hypothetical protein